MDVKDALDVTPELPRVQTPDGALLTTAILTSGETSSQ
jgi:hypothetical protein